MMKQMPFDSRALLAAFGLLSLAGCTVHPAAPLEADVDVSGAVVMGDEHSRVEIIFSSDDRRHIHDYYYRERERHRHGDDYYDDRKKSKKRLPPGLAKRDELPPGLQKQIRRNGRLPPGLEGRALPGELERRLSPLPAGYIRLQVGRDIVLMDQHTRITVDVIKNIFP